MSAPPSFQRSARAEASTLLRQWDGQLTRDLLLTPGKFGLGKVPASLQPTATTSMVCGYCSTGCGLKVHLRESEAVNLTPDAAYPVNLGMACPKGWEALSVLNATDRATTPLLKDADGRQRAVDWHQAMTAFSQRLKGIQREHGPHSIAFLSTGQIATEEMALLGSLAKFGMGILHADSNTRQCMATSAVAYKQSFGFDAPPYTYADFEASDVIVLIGSNLCIGHPILWERVLRNPHRPKIIVLDPRRTETAIAATRHLPLAPKSDQSLLYGLAKILFDRGWVDERFLREHTIGADEFRQFVQAFPLDRVVRESSLSSEDIQWLARTISEGSRVSFWWTMGVNQSYQGVRTAQAIINLALITGNIGRPGTGANSITGQCNAMGSRLFSNTSNLLGGRDFATAEHRQRVADVLGIDSAVIPDRTGWTYDQIIDGIEREEIKGLWIIGTNPAHSWIDQSRLTALLPKLDFLAVQDMYRGTETARLADLVLPAAGWGEKDGTLINSERRIGLIKKVARAPGHALADFAIFKLAAEYWGCSRMFDRWSSPEAVFQILKDLSRGQPFDITGVRDYQMIDQYGGIQWPLPEGGNRGQESEVGGQRSEVGGQHRRLFEDGRFYHADGRARLLFDAPGAMPEPPCAEYPLHLLTGRGTAAQWHTQTRTSKSAVLRKLYPAQPYIEIHPSDALRAGVKSGDPVVVQSRRGSIAAKAMLTSAVQQGQVFMPMHYDAVNQLTLAHFDPHSRQPSYKDCAVRVKPPR
jgi:assimilatory nitrate reductase catalytic subunit